MSHSMITIPIMKRLIKLLTEKLLTFTSVQNC